MRGISPYPRLRLRVKRVEGGAIVDVVVDVGNTRIKWGLCTAAGVTASVSLPHEDPPAWQQQFTSWNLTAGLFWVVSGVAPSRRDFFIGWLNEKKQRVLLLDAARQLPLQVQVENPDHVGIDRLLNAVAANNRRQPDRPAVIVDAGSAVTVDWLDAGGSFCGGAIFPGLRLMARALHQYTALLPLVEVVSRPPLPAANTSQAIAAGIFWAVVGGIQALHTQLVRTAAGNPAVFLTGGDAAILAPALPGSVITWPTMTLEGIRLAAVTNMAEVNIGQEDLSSAIGGKNWRMPKS